jgi:penicillin amidase
VYRRILYRTVIAVVLLALAVVFILWWVLRGSLPILDGTVAIDRGLSNPTVIERDAQGLVSLRGETREDIAFGLGFVHAQERFFQMDLLRRNSAGELSELFGELAADFDSRVRLHQFRRRGEAAIAKLAPGERGLLEAYADGVNTGLAELGGKPFEYLLLQVDPAPWTPADTALTVYSMYMDLQDEWGETERSLSVMHDLLPADWFDFLLPLGGVWDATLDGNDAVFDAPFPSTPLRAFAPEGTALRYRGYRDEAEVGSNNWSVGGARTAHGGGMVADDMHLGLSVPNIWFRASWFLPQSGRRITGATLPGAPLMIVGSNESIAWGFTNSYGDFMDVVRLQTSEDGTSYRTPDGWRRFEVDRETVRVKDGDARAVEVRKTIWGPVIGEDHRGQPLALRWVAHEPEGMSLGLLGFETAGSVDEAVAIANGSGVPGQNLNVVDSSGGLAWTLMGVLPERFGFPSGLEERLVSDWSDGRRGWRGLLARDAYPRIVNPPEQRLWTGNARILGGEGYRVMGDGIGAIGARQQQIRDRLRERERHTAADFLALHLDDEARFLARWQELLMTVLGEAALAGNDRFDDYRNRVADWGGRAGAGSVGYRLVKRFREAVLDATVGRVFAYLAKQADGFWPGKVDNRVEYAAWALVSEQPPAHLPPGYESWPGLLEDIAVKVFEAHDRPDSGLADATWGRANELAISHPLSRAIPVLARFLDMPARPMDGDTYMPRVQGPAFGASQRMAVAPGREEEGYFHMPTGQSAHPLSPFFRRGHEDWVLGRPSSFLPGETAYRLTLQP